MASNATTCGVFVIHINIHVIGVLTETFSDILDKEIWR